MFSLAAQLRELYSIRLVRFSSRAETFFNRRMVHYLVLRQSLCQWISPILRGKPSGTRLDSPMNLEPGSFCCMPLISDTSIRAVSYTHLRAHETRHDIVCR